MLRKLLKYEFAATWHTFIPMYIGILAVSAMVRVTFKFPHDNSYFLTTIMGLTLSCLFIALGVITMLILIQRFNKNLLGEEGYLMFSLPVSAHSLVWSKIISFFVWGIFSMLTAIISFFIIVANKELINELPYLFTKLGYMLIEEHSVILTIELLICMIIQILNFVLSIYASLSTAQISIFSKHRGISSLITFLSIYFTFTTISIWASALMNGFHFYNPKDGIFLLLVAIFINLVFATCTYIATTYLLKNKLNLE